jgi:hypothetical protein
VYRTSVFTNILVYTNIVCYNTIKGLTSTLSVVQAVEIDWLRVRRVVLDDRWGKSKKPDFSHLRKLGQLVPDANIFGFGFAPQIGYWTLLVFSPSFPENPFGVIRDVSIRDVAGLVKPKALLAQKRWFW